MARFLLWNIRKKDLTNQIVRLCHDYDVDVLILAETVIKNYILEESLNIGLERKYFSIYPQFEKVSFFHRFPENYFKPLHYKPQLIKKIIPNIRLTTPKGKEILIFGLHLPSKMYGNEHDLH